MEFRVANEELKAQLESCNGPDDILALAKEEGYELTDEDLEAASGGDFWGPDTTTVTCPACGKTFSNLHCYTTMPCPNCGAYLVPA